MHTIKPHSKAGKVSQPQCAGMVGVSGLSLRMLSRHSTAKCMRDTAHCLPTARVQGLMPIMHCCTVHSSPQLAGLGMNVHAAAHRVQEVKTARLQPSLRTQKSADTSCHTHLYRDTNTNTHTHTADAGTPMTTHKHLNKGIPQVHTWAAVALTKRLHTRRTCCMPGSIHTCMET